MKSRAPVVARPASTEAGNMGSAPLLSRTVEGRRYLAHTARAEPWLDTVRRHHAQDEAV